MFFDRFFRNDITKNVEKKKRIEGQVEVLKKQQKVSCEAVINDFDCKKTSLIDSTNAQINALKAQIASLGTNKDKQCALLDEQKRVALEKTINDFDQKIVSKQNQVNRLIRYIDAEQKNMEDVISPNQPNAPRSTKVLNEDVKTTKKK